MASSDKCVCPFYVCVPHLCVCVCVTIQISNALTGINLILQPTNLSRNSQPPSLLTLSPALSLSLSLPLLCLMPCMNEDADNDDGDSRILSVCAHVENPAICSTSMPHFSCRVRCVHLIVAHKHGPHSTRIASTQLDSLRPSPLAPSLVSQSPAPFLRRSQLSSGNSLPAWGAAAAAAAASSCPAPAPAPPANLHR